MKQSINFSQFCDAFHSYGRENQFSYDGKKALFDFIEDMDDQCDTETELDVIALCCDFVEFADIEEYWDNYGDGCDNIEEISEHTFVIPINDDSFIIQQY